EPEGRPVGGNFHRRRRSRRTREASRSSSSHSEEVEAHKDSALDTDSRAPRTTTFHGKRSQRSVVRDQRSDVRRQTSEKRSEIRDQKSEVTGGRGRSRASGPSDF